MSLCAAVYDEVTDAERLTTPCWRGRKWPAPTRARAWARPTRGQLQRLDEREIEAIAARVAELLDRPPHRLLNVDEVATLRAVDAAFVTPTSTSSASCGCR